MNRHVSDRGQSRVSSLISVWEGIDGGRASPLLSSLDDFEIKDEEETWLFASSIGEKDKRSKVKKKKQRRKSRRKNHKEKDKDDDNNQKRRPIRELKRRDSKVKILLGRFENGESTARSTSERRQRYHNLNKYFEGSNSSIPDEIETNSNNSYDEDEDDNNTDLSYPTFVRPSMQYLPQNTLSSDSSLSSYASLNKNERIRRGMVQKTLSLDVSIGTESTATMNDLSERSNSTTSTSSSTVSILRNTGRYRSNKSLSDGSKSSISRVSWHPKLEFEMEDEKDIHSFRYDNNDDLVNYDERILFWEDDIEKSVIDGKIDCNIGNHNHDCNIGNHNHDSNDDSSDNDAAFLDPSAYLRKYKAKLN